MPKPFNKSELIHATRDHSVRRFSAPNWLRCMEPACGRLAYAGFRALLQEDRPLGSLANLRDAVEGVLMVNAAMTARRLRSSRSRRPVKRPFMQLA